MNLCQSILLFWIITPLPKFALFFFYRFNNNHKDNVEQSETRILKPAFFQFL